MLAGALLIGVFAGSATALWSDDETVTGAIGAGSVAFAVGRTDDSDLTAARGSDDVLEVVLGPAEARVLAETRELALPIRVEALAQGNLGLTYEVQLPQLAPQSILDAADLVLVRVATPGECEVTEPLPAPSPHTSTPVPAEYTDGTTPVREYWCLLGRLEELPLAGTYTNTGSVSADWEDVTVTDSDTWTADLLLDPADEPVVELGFVHETFRGRG